MIAQLQTTNGVAAPAPGIYDDVPRAVYESWPAANFSTLKHFARTPAHAQYLMTVPPEPSDAMDLGAAVHMAILEPERFAEEYLPAPTMNRRTNEGKAAWREFEEANRTKGILSADDWAMCISLRDAAWTQETTAREILKSPGRNERSFVWVDAETGLTCKGRCDRMARWAGRTVVADLKTCSSADPDEFARAISRFWWHVQAAFYLDGLAAIAPSPRVWAWVALEKEPPWLTACYKPTERLLEQGKRVYRRWLGVYAECMRTDQWPGYEAGLMQIDLPRWAQDTQII